MRQLWPMRRAGLAGALALGLGFVSLSISAPAAAARVGPATAAYLASPTATSGTWTIQPSPNKAGAVANELSAVSCVKNGPCEAVGTYTLSTGVPPHQFALILRGSGGTWTLQPTPSIKGAGDSLLNGVSCTSASSCLAVGYTVTTTKNGTVVAPLAERWNGTSWALDSPAKTAGPTPWGILDDVSCPSASSCLAVGGFIKGNAQEQPLAEKWNGTSWTQLTAPNPHAENGSELTSVSCATATACEIDGDYAYADVAESVFAYGFNGTSFAAQNQVNPSGQLVNADNSVSCTSASACTSAGIWTNINNDALGLAERWNGTAWSRQSLPEPPKTTTDELTGVSCTAAAACTAVGDFTTGSGNNPPSAPMAMTWNGTSWRLAATTDPAGGGALRSVSCTSPTTCVAVGAAGTSTLVEVSPG